MIILKYYLSICWPAPTDNPTNIVALTSKPGDVETWLSALGQPGADRDYQPGHERLQALFASSKPLGFVIHRPKLRVRVAGTNGKGSTSHFLAAAFSACGYKVGLYTSPHIRKFHERIVVQHQPIDDDALKAIMVAVMPLALAAGTSYFETATAIALFYFSQQQVDIEILEAGVGAKLDATTAVSGDVGLLTPIALDHQAWLGDELSAIAYEKSFVFDGCSIAISAQQDAAVMRILSTLTPPPGYAAPYTKPLSMIGDFQCINAGLAWDGLVAIHAQGLCNLDLALCAQAIESCQVPGRLQEIKRHDFQFWLDAAHNAHATQALMPELAKLAPFDVIFVCTREDRDLSSELAALAVYATKLVVMTGHQPYRYTSVAEALTAEVNPRAGGKFLILGSFITLAEFHRWLDHDQCPSPLVS